MKSTKTVQVGDFILFNERNCKNVIIYLSNSLKNYLLLSKDSIGIVLLGFMKGFLLFVLAGIKRIYDS
jgi:hypothetical protein